MTKRARQGAILRLVQTREIATQQEMVTALGEVGIDVAQTTVSRDIAELGLVKVRGSSGRLAYGSAGADDLDRLQQLRLALRRWAMSIQASGNIVLVTTPPGFADPLAEVMDGSGHPKLLGTIAGDNTVLAVTREGVTGAEVRDEMDAWLS